MTECNSITSPLLIVLVLAGGLAACAGVPARQDEAKSETFPVQWTQEYSMPSLLDQPPAVRSQPDLRKLLELPWYTDIFVETPKPNGLEAITNCNEYFAVRTENLRAQQAREQNALLEFEVMCEATRLFSEASPARRSNISAQPLNAQLPDKLPKSFALVTSQSEWQRINEDQSATKWRDVNTIRDVKQTSPIKTEYRSDTGMQTLSVLGRGDFNEDGREDLMVTVKDTVEGGSYFNLRLFVLTVTDQEDWQVVKMD